MPYSTVYIEAELFLSHKGINIYHTYKDDDIDGVVSSFHFDTKEASSRDNFSSFDVRNLSTWKEDRNIFSEKAIKQAIKKAINKGELTELGIEESSSTTDA